MRTLAALVLILATTTTTTIAGARPAKPTKATKAQRDASLAACVHERTGPTGGITVQAATRYCRDLAKRDAASERAHKAIEACHQAVVDLCVEGAKPDGSTNCEDDDLRADFVRYCGTAE